MRCDQHLQVNLTTILVSVPGVGVSGVQRGDPRDDGGRVGSDEAAGRRGRHEGERLQTDLQQQRGAGFIVKCCAERHSQDFQLWRLFCTQMREIWK